MSGTRTTLVSAAALAVILALAGCTPGGGTPTSTPTVSDTASTTPTVTPEPEASETVAPEEPSTPGPSDDELNNIADSISSGNTAALEGYMADTVNVIIGASECCGPQSPVEAIATLDYTYSATYPWTFPVPNILMDAAQGGFYASYFPDDAFVGQSSDADPMVISFTFTGDKITGIFVIAGASLLVG